MYIVMGWCLCCSISIYLYIGDVVLRVGSCMGANIRTVYFAC